MNTALIVIVSLIIAIIIVYAAARARIAKNMRAQLKPYELEPGSDRPYFEGNGVKYDKEKYEQYLRDYTGSLPDAQIAFFLAQRGKRKDAWNLRFCEALRAEQARRAELKKASGEIDEAEADEYDDGGSADGDDK